MNLFDYNWLPKDKITGISMTQLRPELFPKILDLLPMFHYALILTLLRLFLSKYFFHPIAQRFVITDGNSARPMRKCVPNARLEMVFKACRRPTEDQLERIAKEISLSFKFVSNWFRTRRNMCKFSNRTKFVESSWRFTYYTIMFAYGVYVLHDEPYITDTAHFFRDYPHKVSDEINLYYMIELGLYLSGMFWIFYEVKRKDFSMMLIHHLATITLMVLSYLSCFTRIGAVILALHDLADILMEAAKLCRYCALNLQCQFLFFAFTLAWLGTRMIYFPGWVIHSILFVSPVEVGHYDGKLVFAGLLCILQVLHTIWFVLILKIAAQPLLQGKFDRDSRSDSDMSLEESDAGPGVESVGNHPNAKKDQSSMYSKLTQQPYSTVMRNRGGIPHVSYS